MQCFLAIATWLVLSGAGVSADSGGSRFAACFFGTGTGQVDRAKIPIDPDAPLDVGFDFTIEFWMKASAANNQGTVAVGQNGDGWITGNVVVDRDVYGSGDYGDYGIALGASGAGAVLAFGANNGSVGETVVGSINVGDDAWHHVAVTRESTSGMMRIYINGVLDAEDQGPSGDLSYRDGRSTAWPASDPFLVLGAEKHDAGAEYPSFTGCLDEFRVWSRVLNTAELARVGGAVLDPGLETGLVGYYRFEEGLSTNLASSSSNAPPGVLRVGVPGNGDWSRYEITSNTAPVAPATVVVTRLDESPRLSFFGQHNFRYNVQSASSLGDAVWLPVTGGTNLTGQDRAHIVTNDFSVENERFLRVEGRSYR